MWQDVAGCGRMWQDMGAVVVGEGGGGGGSGGLWWDMAGHGRTPTHTSRYVL